MSIQAKQTLTALAKFGIALGLIYWIYQKGAIDFAAFKSLVNPFSVSFGMLLMFGLILINNQRWMVLLRARNVNVDLKMTLPLSLIGLFFNYAMPGGVGGDLVKGFYLVKDHPENKLPAAMSIVMDRLIGFFVMVLTAVVALSLKWEKVTETPQLEKLAYLLMLLLAGFVIAFALALNSKIEKLSLTQSIFGNLPGGRTLEKLYKALNSYREKPQALLLAIFLSLISQFTMIVFTYLVGLAMGAEEIPFLAYCFLVPLGIVATAIPISPAGIGVGQAAFYFLFKLYLGYPSQVGPLAITGMQIAQFVLGLIGAFFYLRRGMVAPTEAQMSRSSNAS